MFKQVIIYTRCKRHRKIYKVRLAILSYLTLSMRTHFFCVHGYYFLLYFSRQMIINAQLFSKYVGTSIHTLCISFSFMINHVDFFMLVKNRASVFILVMVEPFVSLSQDLLNQYLRRNLKLFPAFWNYNNPATRDVQMSFSTWVNKS